MILFVKQQISISSQFIIKMSLLIVGSCSRITQNIILRLAKQQLYSKITIADLLPVYDFHRRYYNLRKTLKDERSTAEVGITKLTQFTDLPPLINGHDDVLCVTHDYFQSVTSKTKLMEQAAQFSKHKKNVIFATPIQYDHYGFQNPEQTYLNCERKIRSINPNASILRSDIQDTTELYAYIYKSKNIWEQKLLNLPESFKPKVVNASFYAQQVASALQSKTQGELITVRGQKERHFTEVAHNKDVENYQTNHFIDNIRLLVSKYRGPEDKHSKVIISKF